MNLVFGDSNASPIIPQVIIERYPGMCLHEPIFDFYLEHANPSSYKNVFCFIGTNDVGKGFTVDEMTKSYRLLKEKYPNLFIIGPHSPDIDTESLSKTDGIHLTRAAYLEIKYKILEIIND